MGCVDPTNSAQALLVKATACKVLYDKLTENEPIVLLVCHEGVKPCAPHHAQITTKHGGSVGALTFQDHLVVCCSPEML